MARNKHPEKTVKRILRSAERLFVEKGYEHTTIQDIVDDLGDLTKGAIYHHFKGKEEIIDAVSETHYPSDFSEYLKDEPNGLLKLKKLFRFCTMETPQRELLKSSPGILKNPKMLEKHLHDTVEEIAPMIIPYIKEGVEDGSISTAFPDELGEALMVLINIWSNPLLFSVSQEKFERKILFLANLTEQMGLPIFDEEIRQYMMSYKNIVNIG